MDECDGGCNRDECNGEIPSNHLGEQAPHIDFVG